MDDTNFDAVAEQLAAIERDLEALDLDLIYWATLRKRPALRATAVLRPATRQVVEKHYLIWREKHSRPHFTFSGPT